MSCPRPPTPKVQLPHVEPLGCVRLNFVKVYDKRLILKASSSNPGDNPELFIDLEHPRPGFREQNGPELHFGISANFRLEPQKNSAVKPHIDLYIPESEIHRLLQAIIQANLRRSNRHQAPVGPTSGPQYPPTIRESARVGVSGQRERSGSWAGSTFQSSKSNFSGSGSRSVRNVASFPAPGPRLQARRGE